MPSYGKQGYQILTITLQHMIHDYSLILEHIFPISYNTFLWEVLVPEAAVHLIQGDLVTDQQSAIKVPCDSHLFGNLMHLLYDDSEIIIETTTRAVARLQREESLHWAYLAADTALEMDKWVASMATKASQLDCSNMELDEEELQIKQEEIDAENDFWRDNNMTIGVGFKWKIFYL